MKALRTGNTIAIEPMLHAGTSRYRTKKDGWSIVTADGKRAAHFEHTVAVTGAGPRDPDRAGRVAGALSPLGRSAAAGRVAAFRGCAIRGWSAPQSERPWRFTQPDNER